MIRIINGDMQPEEVQEYRRYIQEHKPGYRLEAIRTLCSSCYDSYMMAGYILRRCWAIVTKSTCDCCQTRIGWTYEVIHRGKRLRH